MTTHMLAKIKSGAVYGVDAYAVEIEVNAGSGDPKVIIVGLPDAAVKESSDRVWTALINSGFFPPRGRTTVNLAPADMKKEGPSFDLPIALGMLAATGALDREQLDHVCAVGELALSGEIRRVRGILPIAMRAREEGQRRLLVPSVNAEEAAVVSGLEVYAVDNLREAVDFLGGQHPLSPVAVEPDRVFREQRIYEEDMADIKGQESARRALEVACAGGHNILLIGPPGTGKTMLAKRVPSILPDMTLEEALETTRIHSIAGALSAHQPLLAHRPFRSPHHTISDAGLLGGGSYPVPGEISMAHHGVLFLDELPEFHRNVLEVLRQPLEEGVVNIARAAASVSFPCRFMLVAAMNPCPCGYYTDPGRECRCTPLQIQRYRNKISGPLLDRIDIHIEVPTIAYDELASMEPGETSESIRQRTEAARAVQRERFRGQEQIHCNANMGSREIRTWCEPSTGAAQMLKMAMTELDLSARAYDRILKVSRTIADMAGDEVVGEQHIAEAIQYRTLDRQIWT